MPTDPERTCFDLDAALREPDRVEELRLGVDDRAALPDDIARLQRLHTLRFALPRLRRLPESLLALPSLRTVAIELTGELDLDHAFTLLASLPSLRSLAVHAPPDHLPRSIARLTQLDALTIEGGHLSVLPAELGALTGLTRLRLDMLPLASLPAELGALTGLRALHISSGLTRGFPATFDRLPDTLGALVHLEDLVLHLLPLVALPDTFGGLGALARLAIINAPLPVLPASFGALGALEDLTLQGTRIPTADLLGALAPLPRLRRLTLAYLPEVELTAGFAGLGALEALRAPHAMRLSVADDFAPPPRLALLTCSRFSLGATDRARLDAAFPRKRWSGRFEGRERVYLRKPATP